MRVNSTEMYLRRFKIYPPATMPASAMSKVDYFRVVRYEQQYVPKRNFNLPRPDFWRVRMHVRLSLQCQSGLGSVLR